MSAFNIHTVLSPSGFTFHCMEWIPGSSPKGLIFLLHGLADHGGRFLHVAKKFNENAFVFVAPDLRGNGLTGGVRGHFDSISQVMDDIDFLYRHFSGKWRDLPVFLYGQSMGGNLAINYCLRKKPGVVACIVSSPWLRLSNPPSRLVQIAGRALEWMVPSMTLSNQINSLDLSHDPLVSKAYDDDPLVHGRISLRSFRVITEAGEWAIRHAGSLNTPILLMHGTTDPITSYEASREFFSLTPGNCTFRSWEGLYHELHNEPKKEEVLDFAINWLQK